MVLTETPLICFRKQRVARNNRPMEQKSRGQQALVSPFQDFQKVHGKKEGKKTKKEEWAAPAHSSFWEPTNRQFYFTF